VLVDVVGRWFIGIKGGIERRRDSAQGSRVAIMFLADTNSFLEVLLDGNKEDACKAFLVKNDGQINISDFGIAWS
jgi:hypothetical protein